MFLNVSSRLPKGLPLINKTFSSFPINWSWRALVEPDVTTFIDWYKEQVLKAKLEITTAPVALSSSHFFTDQKSKPTPKLEQLQSLLNDNFKTTFGDTPTYISRISNATSLDRVAEIAAEAVKNNSIGRDPFLHEVYEILAKYKGNKILAKTGMLDEVKEHVRNRPGGACTIM